MVPISPGLRVSRSHRYCNLGGTYWAVGHCNSLIGVKAEFEVQGESEVKRRPETGCANLRLSFSPEP